MTDLHRIVLLVFIFGACSSSKTHYHRMIHNATFSDVHRNPKVVESEYFEFKNNTFTYTEVRKKFEESYFKKQSYRGSYRISKDSLILVIHQMLFCDMDVIGMNQHPRPKKGGTAPDPDQCSYSYYDIETLRMRKLVEHRSIALPDQYRIVKNANTTKIIALNKIRGRVYEAKVPLIR